MVKPENLVSDSGSSSRDPIEIALSPREGSALEPSPRPPIDQHLERIARLMDRSIRIPGTGIAFGLDPVIGFFFPVAGDAIGAIVSRAAVIASGANPRCPSTWTTDGASRVTVGRALPSTLPLRSDDR